MIGGIFEVYGVLSLSLQVCAEMRRAEKDMCITPKIWASER
jgi:hypothetical protein